MERRGSGWAYGPYYCVAGPLMLGKSNSWVNAPFDPEGVYATMRKYGVTNLAGAPTVYRAMRAGARRAEIGGLRLRVASSAGEPSNPSVIERAEQNLGVEVRRPDPRTARPSGVHGPGDARLPGSHPR